MTPLLALLDMFSICREGGREPVVDDCVSVQSGQAAVPRSLRVP